MTDLETRLRRGLTSYAGALEVEARPFADAPVAAPARNGRRRRRVLWSAGAVVAAAAVGGAAAASVRAPAPVQQVFDELGGDLGLGQLRQSERLAVAETEDGGRIELWMGEGDRACLHQVIVGPDGTYEDAHAGWQHCGIESADAWGDGQLHLLAYPELLAGSSVEGRAPETADRVELELSDGTRTSVRPGAGGWFVVAFSDRLGPSVRLVSASAIADEGGVIDSEDA